MEAGADFEEGTDAAWIREAVVGRVIRERILREWSCRRRCGDEPRLRFADVERDVLEGQKVSSFLRRREASGERTKASREWRGRCRLASAAVFLAETFAVDDGGCHGQPPKNIRKRPFLLTRPKNHFVEDDPGEEGLLRKKRSTKRTGP